MKYAIGNRINFVQFETQFSNEFEMFLAEYAGNNDSKYHKAISVVMQILMRAGNTGGYFLPAEDDDIIIQARQFHIGVAELKAIYDMATKRDVFDRQKFTKNHIITNNALQIAFISAKSRSDKWSMEPDFILDFVYKKYKFVDKNLKIANKLDEFVNKKQSNEPYQNGIEKVVELDCSVYPDDMTLDDFKLKHPNKCLTLKDDWQVPAGVSLKVISEAIERSQKFLSVKAYMTLEKLATDFYEKVCNGFYDDSVYDKNEVKNSAKQSNLTKGLNTTADILEGLPDE